MYPVLASVLLLSGSVMDDPTTQAREPKADKTIEIRSDGGNTTFVEIGKDRAGAVTVVVGQRVRWVNRDSRPHTVASVLTTEGKPLFDTGAINPGEHKDVVFDIDLYRQAGGKPANVARIKYRCDDRPAEAGELQVLSAARRGAERR